MNEKELDKILDALKMIKREVSEQTMLIAIVAVFMGIVVILQLCLK